MPPVYICIVQPAKLWTFFAFLNKWKIFHELNGETRANKWLVNSLFPSPSSVFRFPLESQWRHERIKQNRCRKEFFMALGPQDERMSDIGVVSENRRRQNVFRFRSRENNLDSNCESTFESSQYPRRKLVNRVETFGFELLNF